MEGEEIVYDTAVKLLETLDRDNDGFKIVACGIVVVFESEDRTNCRTRTSTDRYYIKRGIWEQALETIRNGTPVDEND